MKLYVNAASPFARKVRTCLIEAGLTERVEVVQAAGNAVDPGTMPVDVNPLGKIPTLVTDDGRTLFDSRVICRWLDRLTGGRFYPQDAALWDVLVVEALADGMMEAAILMVYEARLRPEAQRFAPWVEGQWAKIDRALDELEQHWLPLLNGPFGMAQIGVASALGYLDLRLGARGWRQGRPGLAALEERLRLRPSLAATLPV